MKDAFDIYTRYVFLSSGSTSFPQNIWSPEQAPGPKRFLVPTYILRKLGGALGEINISTNINAGYETNYPKKIFL